jgi:Fe-S-cluster containining protein
MRPCDDCTACCTWLKGSAYGYEFGEGKSCKFLCKTGCDIHKARPTVCEGYFCAWAQELLPEEMRPDKCGVLASVENNNGQYLRLTLIDGKINIDILEYFKEWSIKMNTLVLYLNNNIWEVL